MKNILVPIDFSECANYAADVAIKLAIKDAASISFLHIMPNTNEGWHVPHIIGVQTKSQERIQARNYLAALIRKAEEVGLTAKQFLVFEKGEEKIEDYIKPLNIDFIVMGCHGVSGIREIVLGSNSQRMIKRSTVPILIVKHPETTSFQLKNILYASTFERGDTPALKLVADLAKTWKATLNILFIHMLQKNTERIDQDKIIAQLHEENPSLILTSSAIDVNDEEWGIHQFAKMINADIVALTTHDHYGLLTQHNVAEDLANHEDLPVLVIK